ncbi:hypothetical protein PPL_11874 [Heterostelium album PN500]|uniref:Uncharacterized protein n=1 Tax=Heterostelium pallidum (strain ATCC 26659 / Pp 5 / PN500) TaxID=670386 RepID=D3BUQ3_HETP5|nr:hypothetical protein PPL_11874 [Heterostelium album PN500]EFA74841.1 hypothetical protein PPL_11874 [Heterostelium album PN500]|eukprot:XP_020426975.1 hypothetical protein PPL_11874 [Heterostelium album PN500]
MLINNLKNINFFSRNTSHFNTNNITMSNYNSNGLIQQTENQITKTLSNRPFWAVCP